MLDARQLHAIARDRAADPPEPFAAANATIAAAEQARRDRDQLVREAHELGIPWTVLERWTGLSARHLHRIVHGRTD